MGFLDKTKSKLSSAGKGIKSFFVKTGRRNGLHYYGFVVGIGDLIVYDDHALISAVGMDDVVIKKENVVSCHCDGLGPIKTNTATFKYVVELDDNVVFPEKVRQKNDVKNLTVHVIANKCKDHYLGKGSYRLTDCEVYGYDYFIAMVLKKEEVKSDKTRHYEESKLYGHAKIKTIDVTPGSSESSILFDDGSLLTFSPKDEKAISYLVAIKTSN